MTVFKQHNANPKGRKTNDCVIRAISAATRMTWEDVFTDLCRLALKTYEMPNNKKVYEKYLHSLGWKKHPMPRFADNTRYTVKEFIAENPQRSAIISVARHLTFIDNGILLDTWNCSNKSLGNYWTEAQDDQN